MTPSQSLRNSASLADRHGKPETAAFFRKMAADAVRTDAIGLSLYQHWAIEAAEHTAKWEEVA